MAIAHDVDAAAAGLEVRRLERIGEHLRDRYLDPGKLAGCQVLVWRRGHVAYFESLGNLELKGARPVRDDTIWRIFSMTKPITSVALMTLYEEGRFQLSDPVERFIPSWRDLKVVVRDGAGLRSEVPARPMNIRDLLMHTSGLTYGRELDHPASRMYQEAGLLVRDFNLGEMARRLAEMPLVFHPGTSAVTSWRSCPVGRSINTFAKRCSSRWGCSTPSSTFRRVSRSGSPPITEGARTNRWRL